VEHHFNRGQSLCSAGNVEVPDRVDVMRHWGGSGSTPLECSYYAVLETTPLIQRKFLLLWYRASSQLRLQLGSVMVPNGCSTSDTTLLNQIHIIHHIATNVAGIMNKRWNVLYVIQAEAHTAPAHNDDFRLSNQVGRSMTTTQLHLVITLSRI